MCCGYCPQIMASLDLYLQGLILHLFPVSSTVLATPWWVSLLGFCFHCPQPLWQYCLVIRAPALSNLPVT